MSFSAAPCASLGRRRARNSISSRNRAGNSVASAANCYGRRNGNCSPHSRAVHTEDAHAGNDTPLYHQLADQIHELIRAGTLRAGDRVPSVRKLSNQQRVSVSTVLQAYQRLEDIGVIEARPQSGYYVRRLSAGVQEPEPSRPPKRALAVEVNELTDTVLAYATDPKVVVRLGVRGGGALPSRSVRRVLSSVARRDRNALGRYGLPPGTEKLRRAVARRARMGMPHRPPRPRDHDRRDRGDQPRAACRHQARRPGRARVADLYGFLQILQSLGLRALEIPTHPRSGISLEALELALAEHPVKAVLVMPNVSNPIGASMSDAAKKRLVELLAAKNVPLIEDHIYAELHSSRPRRVRRRPSTAAAT